MSDTVLTREEVERKLAVTKSHPRGYWTAEEHARALNALRAAWDERDRLRTDRDLLAEERTELEADNARLETAIVTAERVAADAMKGCTQLVDGNARLRAALEPFAELARRVDDASGKFRMSDCIPLGLRLEDVSGRRPTLGDCRAARVALERKDGGR